MSEGYIQKEWSGSIESQTRECISCHEEYEFYNSDADRGQDYYWLSRVGLCSKCILLYKNSVDRHDRHKVTYSGG